MPVEGDVLFKSREEILTELQDQMRLLIPDVYLGPDGNLNLLFQVLAGVSESIFQAIQIVSEDMFVMTANEGALENYGAEYGEPRKAGTSSIGQLLFTGEGGTVIPIDAEVAYDAGTGDDPLYFRTTETDTIPNPGIPGAPTLATSGTGGAVPTGTYEGIVTFVTAQGETLAGAESNALVKANTNQIQWSAIPVGGPGTIARKLYRQVNDGGYFLLTTINDNVATTFLDNTGNPPSATVQPTISTAERIVMDAASEDPGEVFNVLANTITVLVNVPDGITSVTNTAPFTGGTEQEAVEDYRQRLLDLIRSPGTGAIEDVRTVAEGVEGVDTATVYENDNLGTPTNGHVTVRIAGPNGTVPGAGVIASVQTALDAMDWANVVFHVGTFTPTTTAVTYDVTVATGYTLLDVTPSVVAAASDYINSLDVGETWRHTGAEAAVWGLPGILDVVITSPASNQATGSTSKRTPGTITVV